MTSDQNHLTEDDINELVEEELADLLVHEADNIAASLGIPAAR